MKEYLVKEFNSQSIPLQISTNSEIVDDNVITLAQEQANLFINKILKELEQTLKDTPKMFSRSVYKKVNDVKYVTSVKSSTDKYVHVFIADVEINIYETYQD